MQLTEFMKKLSDQTCLHKWRNPSPLTNYYELFSYLFVLASFDGTLVRFLCDDVGVISYSAFSLCFIFKRNWNKLIIMIKMINITKYNNNRHIPIEIVNS